MIKQDNHAFQGMKKDSHPIRQEGKFLWEAHNIRFTALEDNTLLSMTNEKGNKKINTIGGHYVGHCVVGNYLVVFTYVRAGLNYIYRLEKRGNHYNLVKLYEGDLNMVTESPAQTIGVYENDLVQKVYWVDGKNQPRVINIVADKLLGITLSSSTYATIYPKGCFDFIRELALEEDVEVERIEGIGQFPTGTIQYAFSYYNKYSQESNIFYTTGLYNTSPIDRGGSPEEVQKNSFNITIKNVETKFQYIRVYSIQRTTLNTTPIVKVVTDLTIDSNAVSFTDDGMIGYNIDPTRLLYIGGESIIANTITSKDNTLFLGNIKLNRLSIPSELKTSLKGAYKNRVNITTREITINYSDELNYHYDNQLKLEDYTSFKGGETYRLGVQFQHNTGKWSEPVWLGDYAISNNYKPVIDTNLLVVNKLLFNLTPTEISTLGKLGYKKARAMIVLPTINDRDILAQGVVCPTVFSIKDRLNNTPFAQSSWFFRPMSESWKNDIFIDKGAIVEFAHLRPLIGYNNRGAEIQSMVYKKFNEANTEAKSNPATDLNTFFVDQSIVTFHSPDIEFDESTKIELNNTECLFNIVGLVPIASNAGDINIQTSSPAPGINDVGFYHKQLISSEYSNRILASGLFYRSHYIDNKYTVTDGDNADKELSWMVYPWHRTGSLNNDATRPADKGARTAVLKRKVISNLRFSYDTKWLQDNSWHSFDTTGNKNGITKVNVFDSNEVSLIKIDNYDSNKTEKLNYYGNVDSLITTRTKYPFLAVLNTRESTTGGKDYDPFVEPKLHQLDVDSLGTLDTNLAFSKDPVRMKYKSSPHAVFAFKKCEDGSQLVLPKLVKNINQGALLTFAPFWEDNTDLSNYTELRAVLLKVPAGSTEAQTEGNVIAVLNTGYSDDKVGTVAASICSIYPTNTEYADLYIKTAEGSAWQKYNFRDYDLGNIYKFQDTYYKTIYVNQKVGYVLKKILAQATKDYLQETINTTVPYTLDSFLYIGELVRATPNPNKFGGTTDEALRNNQWIPAGKSVSLGENIEFTRGDTYYQRYDCLKTYSFTNEDENSIIDIASFMCETRVNIDGRYDKNRGLYSNLNVSPSNFNLLNNVYSQKDNFFNYRIMDDLFYKEINYPTQVLWSLEKKSLESIDTWTNVTLANSLELDGNNGKLTSLNTFNENLVAFQDKAINYILFNSRVQINASDGIPIEVANSGKVDGSRVISNTIGCQDKNAIIKSPLGLYFIDSITDSFYLFNGELKDIGTTLGNNWWLKKFHSNNPWYIINNEGIRLSYDPVKKDVYLTPANDPNGEVLCYSEQLGCFTSLLSYNSAVLLSFNGSFLSLLDNINTTELWENFKGDYNSFYGNIKLPSFTYISNEDAYYTKIFDTIEYKADVYINNTLSNTKTFDWIKAYNEYQDSGIKHLNQSRRILKDNSLRKKFRVWRGQIPRQGRERMRNPWTAITLGFNEDKTTPSNNNFKMVLHDISTKYTI